jgi:hypothetical protein
MSKLIDRQNYDLEQATLKHKAHRVYNNNRLAMILGIQQAPDEYRQSYIENDINVSVIV